MNCHWEEFDLPNTEGWRRVKCERCGFVTHPTPHEVQYIYRECSKKGMGDHVATGLAAFGITQRRVAWVKGLFFEKPDCGGCPERQEALNELGAKLGL